MFGKSYFSLGISEKIAVDQAVAGMVWINIQNIKPEMFADQTGKGFVFQGPPAGGDKIQ
jgi:hypothetical protein